MRSVIAAAVLMSAIFVTAVTGTAISSGMLDEIAKAAGSGNGKLAAERWEEYEAFLALTVHEERIRAARSAVAAFADAPGDPAALRALLYALNDVRSRALPSVRGIF